MQVGLHACRPLGFPLRSRANNHVASAHRLFGDLLPREKIEYCLPLLLVGYRLEITGFTILVFLRGHAPFGPQQAPHISPDSMRRRGSKLPRYIVSFERDCVEFKDWMRAAEGVNICP